MRKQTRLILLTVAAVAATSTVQAAYKSGDLLVGFTSGGATNDYVFDVGALSGLSNGETWTLGANLGGAFTTSQFASADWGVIGALASTATIYSSAGSLGVPSEDAGSFNTIRPNVAAVGAGSIANSAAFISQSSTASWFTETDQAPGTPGNYFFNNLDNPNVKTSATAYLYANDNLGDPATPAGDFTISADGNTLTYSAVPEPTAISLLGGFGLLAFLLRRRSALQA
jgi:hypothetical protein